MKKNFSFVVLNCNPYLYRKIKSTFFKPHISSLPDEELLARYNRTGDTKYFGELYNRYIPLLYGVCLKYLGNAEKAEDAVMQLFEELTEKIGRYEIAVFRTWLYSVVKNHCFQLLRKEEREIPVNFDADFMESADIVHLLSDDEEDSRLPALQKCMRQLPPQQRECIELFFMQEQSYADIASRTGYSLNHVKSYIQNGKRNLKICILKQGDE